MEIEIEGGVRVKINQKDNNASVVKSPKANGNVFIPHYAEYENKKYKIISIEDYSFDKCHIDSLTFAKDSEVEIFKSFSGAYIKKLEIPASLKKLKDRWCNLLYDEDEIIRNQILYIVEEVEEEEEEEANDNVKEELSSKLLEAEKEISKLKEEILKLKDDNKKLKRKVAKLEEKNKTEVKKDAVKLDHFDPKSIDALKVVRTIGRGGQSEVFEVIQENRLALKVLFLEGPKKNDSQSFKQLQRFLQEYEILLSLNHANIIKTFGFCYGDSNHAPSILLELCEKNLNDRISEMNNIEKVCSIIEICQAMESVHAANMIHRDLRPENILFDNSGHVKISDFGVSCFVDVDSEAHSKASSFGTLKFMAPELLNESTKYDNKVDIYSFGVVLFFILTGGKVPKISIIEQGNGKKAQIPANVNKISRDLIQSCWSTKPGDRPSFTEILNVIKKNKFKLINGVEKNTMSIKKFVKL